MRRLFLVACAAVAAATTVPSAAWAQMQRPGQGPSQGQDPEQAEESAQRRKRDSEWGDNRAPLPQLRNAGPCPFVKTLYDAARYVEFKDGREAAAAVGYTGEIQGISAGCQYKDDEPIRVAMEVLFDLGRGPQATSDRKTYRYWVAVTDRNRLVLAKQTFDLPVNFAAGKDRVQVTERLNEIVIPRATLTTSGGNFEILIGFEVTPEMAAFNRDGKRFRPSVAVAGTTPANP
jgi:hypothetical protein